MSTNRPLATSVSFTDASRPPLTTCDPSAENAVASAQSSCVAVRISRSPVAASKARTASSTQPTATFVPSGDQLAPNTVSAVTGTLRSSVPVATSQICSSPASPGDPPVTASFAPSGEYRTDCTRSESPTSRPVSAPVAGSVSRTSWKPATASVPPSGDQSSDAITGGPV